MIIRIWINPNSIIESGFYMSTKCYHFTHYIYEFGYKCYETKFE